MFNSLHGLPFLADGLTDLLPMFLLLGVVWIFLVILPGRRERRAKDAMLAGLKKGEKVLLQSGIIGKIDKVKDDTVALDFGGTKITFLRNTVVKIYDKKDSSSD